MKMPYSQFISMGRMCMKRNMIYKQVREAQKQGKKVIRIPQGFLIVEDTK